MTKISKSTKLSILSCSILTLQTLLIGMLLLIKPSTTLNNIFFHSCGINSSKYYENEDDNIDVSLLETTLARLLGAALSTFGMVFFGFLVSSYFITLSSPSSSLSVTTEVIGDINNGKAPQRGAIENIRTALLSQATLGIFFLLVGLLEISSDLDHASDDKGKRCNGKEESKALPILCGGAIYFVFACFGLMSSFFPSISRDSPLPNNENQGTENGDGENMCCTRTMSSRQRERRTILSSCFKFLSPWRSSGTNISAIIGSHSGNEAMHGAEDLDLVDNTVSLLSNRCGDNDDDVDDGDDVQHHVSLVQLGATNDGYNGSRIDEESFAREGRYELETSSEYILQEADENMSDKSIDLPTEYEDMNISNNNNIGETSILPDLESRIRGTRRLIKLAGPHSFYLYIGCVVLLIRLPFSLSIPHFVSVILESLARAQYDSAKINILLLFILGTVDAVLDFWCVFLFGLANQKIVKGVRVDTFAAIFRQEMGFFDVNNSGDLASRLNSDCGEMGGDLTWFFRFSIESVVRITGIVAYMMIRSPRLGVYAISVVPAVALVNKKYGDWLHKNAMAVQDSLAEANSVAQEAISCIRTVFAFATENYEHERYRKKIDSYYELNILQLYAQGFYYMFVSTFIINTCVQALLLYIGTLMIRKGTLSAGVLLSFMLYQGQLQNEVLNLFNSFTSLIKSSGAGDKVFALLDRITPAPGTGSQDVVSNDNTGSNEYLRPCTVTIRNLNFAYPTRNDNTVLTNLALDIPAGTSMALVGGSGCGKSTIISLLQRFYDPLSGEIMIDGVDLRNINLKAHRRYIGVVTQDPVLFSGTIKSNISYGCPNATDEEIIEVAKLANAHGFIENFDDKYDTEVGERGAQLSGGQKQRIAIARALMRRPSLLLLDEATSALDSEAEKLVQEALDHLLAANQAMTTVIVAHRLQTVKNSDCIAVIKDGHVVEKGAHKELMENPQGFYRKMVERSTDNGFLPEH